MKYAAMKRRKRNEMENYETFITDDAIENRLFFGRLLKSIDTARKMLPVLNLEKNSSVNAKSISNYGSTEREQFLNCSKEYCLQKTVDESILSEDVRIIFNNCKTLLSMAVNEADDEKFFLCMMVVYERAKDLK